MGTRTYNLGKRKASAEETRARIVAAARALLAEAESVSAFTVDAIARAAGVARMTIYHQFGSKGGLVEALCDSLALAGGMQRLAAAFHQPDSLRALDEFVATFGSFWEADRAVMRRLLGLGALDPEIAAVLAARDERRRGGIVVIIDRIAEQHGIPAPAARETTIALLHALTSFALFDQLAGESPVTASTPQIQRLARLAIGARA